MFKKYAKIIGYIVASAIVISSVTFSCVTQNRTKDLSAQVKNQNKIIDSLLHRRMEVYDVTLHVTDQSKSTIYGKYNKGSIIVPQEKKYILELDSVSISKK